MVDITHLLLKVFEALHLHNVFFFFSFKNAISIHIGNGIKHNAIFFNLAHKVLEMRLGIGILGPQDEIGTQSTVIYRFNSEIGLRNLGE